MSQIDLLRRHTWTPSPQNGGRHQIRTGGRLTFGMPGRHHWNPQPNTGTGPFTITFVNNGGKTPALSHMIITGGDAATVHVAPLCVDCCIGPTCSPDGSSGGTVPEPMTISILALGLVGLGAVRKVF